VDRLTSSEHLNNGGATKGDGAMKRQRIGQAACRAVNLFYCTVLAAVLIVGQACTGQTIVTNLFDTFTDGGRTNGSDPLDTAWYGLYSLASPVTPTIVWGDKSPLSGWNLHTRISDCAGGAFAAVTLDAKGEYIEVSADLWALNTLGGTSFSGWLVGLFNSGETPLTADITSSPGPYETDDDDGYWVTKDVHGGVTNNDFLIKRQDGVGRGFRTYSGTALATSSTGNDATDTDAHRIGMRVTLADNLADLIVTCWFDGYTNSITHGAGATLVGTTFDMVYIGGSSGAQDLQARMDNITVTSYLIPARGTVLSIQ
jgi:hypothetical protein